VPQIKIKLKILGLNRIVVHSAYIDDTRKLTAS
jgi:hypothetical protein